MQVGADQLLDPLGTAFQGLHRGAEAEPAVAVIAGVAAPLAGIHVEEHAGHGDHLDLEQRLEELDAVVQGRREVIEVAPDVEGALRFVFDRYSQTA